MRRRWLTIPLLSAALIAAPAPAAATTLRTLGGSALAPGSPLSATLKSGTHFHIEGGSAGDLDCTRSTFDGAVETNPSPLLPLPATARVTSFTLSGCTDTIPFWTVSSVTTNASPSDPRPARASYLGSASTLAIDGLEVTFTFSNGSWCTYAPTGGTMTAQHNSLTSPWNAEYAFSAVPVTKTGGTALICPANPTWTMTYVAASAGAGMTIQA